MANSPDSIQISKQTARRFLLDHHFLLPPRQVKSEEIVRRIFNRLGCIQFDTINVVGRNADLVLQSRVKDYSPKTLEKLLYEERSLIDGWDKMASIYPTTDWPFFRRRRESMGANAHNRSEQAAKAAPGILVAIRQNGAMSSIEFKDDRKTDWSWAPTTVSRAALEAMYLGGTLGIDHRVNTRRVFDLIGRLIPEEILKTPDPYPDDREHLKWHLLRRLGSMGLAMMKTGEYWLGIHGGRKAADRRAGIQSLVEEGLVTTLSIEEIPDQEFYLRTEDFHRMGKLSAGELNSAKAAFIAPLDNLIWNRNQIGQLFDFSYIWEVYKPKKIREYGYYVLPVLYQDRLIARVDMRHDRKTNILNLIDWWWEAGVRRTPEMEAAIRDAFGDFLIYLGGDQIKLIRENFTSKRQASLFESLTGSLK